MTNGVMAPGAHGESTESAPPTSRKNKSSSSSSSSPGETPDPDRPAVTTATVTPPPAQRTGIAAAATQAHWNGLHMAMGDVHCPVCQAQGYVGAGYDTERQNYGGTP